MRKQWFIMLLILFAFVSANAQEDTWKGPSVNFKHGKLKVSENKRYLVHKDGTPFFYLADTAWELFHRLNEEEVETYFENRRAKGFTVIQAVILAELDGLKTPNAYGDVPLTDTNILTPNEKYYKWVDKVIKMAEAKGLYIGLLPTWGDKVDKQWGVGPEIFNPMYAGLYGVWLGRRYKKFKNIIWINGGDRWGGDGNYSTWEALGNSIRKEDKNHLMTFHPLGENSSSQWFHNSPWLDFNMSQTSHCQRSYEICEKLIVRDYNKENTKPCLDGEARYENHPMCGKPELGWFDDVDIRQAMYWSLFSGACGHTYGCHDIWQMLTPERQPVGWARGNWKTSLDLPGAFDVIHARRLMERFDWDSREPAQSMILSKNTDYLHKIVAIRGNGYALVYFPNGEKAKLDVSGVAKGKGVTQKWMNPWNGQIAAINKPAVQGVIEVTPPSSGRGEDWILILEEVAGV